MINKNLFRVILSDKIIFSSYVLVSILEVIYVLKYKNFSKLFFPEFLTGIKNLNVYLLNFLELSLFLLPLTIIIWIYFSFLKRRIFLLYAKNKNLLLNDKDAIKNISKFFVFWHIVLFLILVLSLILLYILFTFKMKGICAIVLICSLILAGISFYIFYITLLGSVVVGLEKIKIHDLKYLSKYKSFSVLLINIVYLIILYLFLLYPINYIFMFLTFFGINIITAYILIENYIKKSQSS